MINAAQSYRCKISEGNTRGSLYLGLRNFQVDVVELSRDCFTVRVPAKIARKLSVGSSTKLLYQEMLWSVRCSNKWIGRSGSDSVDLELEQLEELTPTKVPKGAFANRGAAPPAATQTDPTLPVALLGAFLLMVLILPSWGGQWGTSELVCNAVTSTWNALGQLITGKR